MPRPIPTSPTRFADTSLSAPGGGEGRGEAGRVTKFPQEAPDAASGSPRSLADQKRRFFWRLVLPVLGFLGLITLLPVLYLVVTSLTPLTLTNPASAWDFTRPLANYVLLLSDTRLHESLWTQAKLSFFTVALQLLLGLWAAMVVHARPLTGEVIRTAFLIPMVLPPIVVAIIWKVLYSPDISPFWWIFNAFGWSVPSPITDARLALGAIIVADTWQWFPFTMLIILAALKLMPDEWIEAALVDGATEWQTFRYITLPYLKGSLLVAGLFRLIDSIKAFPLIYILTDGGPGTVTEITNYYTFVQAFSFSYIGYSSAITVCLVVLVAVLSWIIVRLVEGEPTYE